MFTTYRHRAGRKVGTALHPRNVLRTLHTLLTAACLLLIRFHDLRHSAASLLIAEGVELVEVSMLLGHSELRVTADLYSHLQKQTSARAARRMNAVLNGYGGNLESTGRQPARDGSKSASLLRIVEPTTRLERVTC